MGDQQASSLSNDCKGDRVSRDANLWARKRASNSGISGRYRGVKQCGEACASSNRHKT